MKMEIQAIKPPVFTSRSLYNMNISKGNRRGQRGRDHMVVGFTTTCAISAYRL